MFNKIKTHLTIHSAEYTAAALTASMIALLVTTGYQYGVTTAVKSADIGTSDEGRSLVLVHLSNGLTKTLKDTRPVT